MKRLLILLAVISLLSACHNVKKTPLSDPQQKVSAYYNHLDAADDTGWTEDVLIFHFWREIDSQDYLFEKSSNEQAEEWELLCEGGDTSGYVLPLSDLMGYSDMNQYVTVHDFYSLWDSFFKNDDMVLWRLEQYDTVPHYCNTEYEKFSILKKRIQSLTEFEPQFQVDYNNYAALAASLQEFYDRVLLREAKACSRSEVAQALEEENDLWLVYHAAVDSTFRIIDGNPEGMVGSAWPMSISGIRADNAYIRENSLVDYYFTMMDGPDNYEQERHVTVSGAKVLKEYQRFMNSFEEDEAYYPIPERKKAMALEIEAWKKWMTARAKVSSLLDGVCKGAYDNSTNNIRRMKYIMLKNRYSGYGITSDDVWRLQMPYNVDDTEIDGPSFDERWKALLDSI